jgi:hypothetical protein
LREEESIENTCGVFSEIRSCGTGEIRLRRVKYFASRNVKYLPFGQMLRKKSVKAVALTDFIL